MNLHASLQILKQTMKKKSYLYTPKEKIAHIYIYNRGQERKKHIDLYTQ